jgi:predicted phage terminase large subunit-like protein
MSIDYSAKLSTKSNDELHSLVSKLRTYKRTRTALERLSKEEFRRKYPTPGHLAQAYLPSTRQTPALQAIDRHLVKLADAPDDRGRSMIFMAPQEGKSTRASCWFVLWMLAQDPSLRIVIVSYAANKAERWGKWLRRMIEAHAEFGITLMADSRASDKWETTAGGQVVSVGISGGVSGEPCDLMVIDDPLAGRAEAESPTYRRRAQQWWESDASTRLGNHGKVLLMLTRWHADDLAGWLMNNEPGEWDVLRIPVLREDGVPIVRGDDGASVYSPHGELISTRDRRPGYFRELRDKRSPYVFRSIYMQTPVAAEGNLFPRTDFRYWWPMPPDPSHHDPTGGQRVMVDGVRYYLGDTTRFITMDLAQSTKTSADFTVASVWALAMDGQLILLDMRRARVTEADHFGMVKPLTQMYAATTVYVEKGFIGSTLIREATKAVLRVQGVDPDKDKVTRAIPAANRVRAHQAFFPANAEWLDDICDELAGFPAWVHDDFVDTFSYAERIASAYLSPPSGSAGEQPLDDDETEIVTAHRDATGYSRPLDLDRAEW